MPKPPERDSFFYTQKTSQLNKKWLRVGMSKGARLAWFYAKGYVKVHAMSQKDPGRAPAMDIEDAAYDWNVDPEDVAEMIAKATAAGEFRVEGKFWRITEVEAFQSPSTIARRNQNASQSDEEQPEIQTDDYHIWQSNDAFDDQTARLNISPVRATDMSHATGTGTGIGTSPPDSPLSDSEKTIQPVSFGDCQLEGVPDVRELSPPCDESDKKKQEGVFSNSSKGPEPDRPPPTIPPPKGMPRPEDPKAKLDLIRSQAGIAR